MQQGSDMTPLYSPPLNESGVALTAEKARVVALKEVSSTCMAMQGMANYCIDQGHVTVDHMEAMADLLGMMRRQLDLLRFDLISH